jgi:hypothetical protein
LPRLHRAWQALLSSSEVIRGNSTENEPRRSGRASQRSADFRPPDARIIAHRNLDNPEILAGSLQDQFHGPPVSGLFEGDCAENICSCGAERAEIADLEPVQIRDQLRREPVPEQVVPGKCSTGGLARETRTDGDVGAPLGDRGKQKRKFGRSIAIIAVEKDHNVGFVCGSETCQAHSAISAARLRNNSRAHSGCNFRGSVGGLVVDNNDFGYEIGGNVGEHATDRLRLISRGNHDRDVGDYAAQRLLDLDFAGKQTRELLGERNLSMTEATAIIARGIGKPDLRYVQFPYDQVQQVLEQMGMSPKKAAVYIEVFKAINTGVLAAQEPRSRENTTPTSFETLVQDVFASAYHGRARVA